MNERLERTFPRLVQDGYAVTSPRTPRYNCVAWAAGDDSQWWEPSGDNEHFLPSHLAREYTFQYYLEAFRALGYESCADGQLEPGHEKIAIHADAHNNLTHEARQLATGQWTSKLGQWEDIQHNTLAALEGGGHAYGTATRFMKRLLSVEPAAHD